MERITLPSDEVLLARRAEIIGHDLDRDKATWQSKICSLESDIEKIRQQIARLRSQADQGDYSVTSPALTPHMIAATDEYRNREKSTYQLSTKDFLRTLGSLGIQDGKLDIHCYRTVRESHMGYGDTHEVDDCDVNVILSTQGDTVMYARQSAEVVAGKSDIPRGESVEHTKADFQLLLNPTLDAPLIRRDAYMTDPNTSNYEATHVEFAIKEVYEAIQRTRINRLIENVSMLLMQSNEIELSPSKQQRQQTHTLDAGDTVTIASVHRTTHEIDHTKPARTLEETRDNLIPTTRLEAVHIDYIDSLGARRYIRLSLKYLRVDICYDLEKQLDLSEAENLVARIAEEKV